jgi:hypothetical protein
MADEAPAMLYTACDRADADRIELFAIEFEEDPESSGPLVLVANTLAEAAATDAALRARGSAVPACWRLLPVKTLQETGLTTAFWRIGGRN